MANLLIAEHDEHQLSEQTARVLSGATQLGGETDILVAGCGVGAIALAAARLQGVRRVLVADAPALVGRLAEPIAALIEQMVSSYAAVLAPASAAGRNILPRLAALLDVQPISNVIEILAPDTFKRPIYAGNALQVVRSADPVKVLTLRASAFTPAATGGTAPVEDLVCENLPFLSRHLGNQLSEQDRPGLIGARIVVSGGRAFGSAEHFNSLLLPLADRLGAAIGASRAAVDAGYAPNDWQVGQTGKIVAPDLYIAAGISGAIQHLAGMKDSKVIVAINNDPDAPIFQVADYGLVGDVFTILPELIACL